MDALKAKILIVMNINQNGGMYPPYKGDKMNMQGKTFGSYEELMETLNSVGGKWEHDSGNKIVISIRKTKYTLITKNIVGVGFPFWIEKVEQGDLI